MSFEASCTDIKLDGSTLKVKISGTENTASLDLDKHIGNNDGDFTIDSSGYHSKSINHSLVLDSSGKAILKASLYTSEKKRLIVDRTFELTWYVGNNNGTLVFNKP